MTVLAMILLAVRSRAETERELQAARKIREMPSSGEAS